MGCLFFNNCGCYCPPKPCPAPCPAPCPTPCPAPCPTITATGFSASNTIASALDVTTAGVTVPLSTSNYISGFTTTTGDQFTATYSGTYLISYGVNLSASTVLSSAVTKNGAAIASSIVTPTVASTNYANSFITTLSAGDILALTLYNATASITLASGVGAYMNVIRIA